MCVSGETRTESENPEMEIAQCFFFVAFARILTVRKVPKVANPDKNKISKKSLPGHIFR